MEVRSGGTSTVPGVPDEVPGPDPLPLVDAGGAQVAVPALEDPEIAQDHDVETVDSSPRSTHRDYAPAVGGSDRHTELSVRRVVVSRVVTRSPVPRYAPRGGDDERRDRLTHGRAADDRRDQSESRPSGHVTRRSATI